MNDPSDQATNPQKPEPPARPGRGRRFARWAAVVVLAAAACVSVLTKDHIRTLSSLRRVPGTNAYVIDYYADYNLDDIRARGMDVRSVEDGLIAVYFPTVIESIVKGVKGWYIDRPVKTISPNAERCSTVVLRTPGEHVFFGRNFDWMHDACLIVRIHDEGGVASIAVIDPHYLNLDRKDLERTNLIQRIPLLFAPYYLQDGMNRHGVAVSDMSVEGSRTPYDPGKPKVLHATAMRLILDDAKTVDDALEILDRYNIHFGATTIHLMLADASGQSAVVEFIDGKIEVTTTEGTWQVCTNHQICGTSEADSDTLCERYRLASDELSKLDASAGTNEIMGIMQAVSKEEWTMWSSVYDLSARKIRVAYRRQYDNAYNDSLVGSD